jgi:hypothetical protein
MLSAFKEWLHFRRQVKDLVRLCTKVHAANPDLSGSSLYKEVLLQTTAVDEAAVDQTLRRAEVDLDEWMNTEDRTLGFREVVHYHLLTQHLKDGGAGIEIALDDIVRALVPKDL